MPRQQQTEPTLHREPGFWIAAREKLLSLNLAADEVLRNSVTPLPGNLRYALDAQAQDATLLLGEFRDVRGVLTPAEVQSRLSQGESTTLPIDADLCLETASVLSEGPYSWSPKPSEEAGATEQKTSNESTIEGAPSPEWAECWAAIANDSNLGPIELEAFVLTRGVEVTAKVAALDESLEPICAKAIALLLARAHARLRFTRFVADPQRVLAVSFATHDRRDIELPDSVAATVAAAGYARREVQALTDPQVAKTYLDCAPMDSRRD